MTNIVLAMLGTALLGAVGAANAHDTGAPAARGGPIHVTFVIHFDPLFAPGGEVLRRSYEAERDNLAWLAEYLDRLEKEKGKEFVPRLTLEMAGDHAEWYLEDEKGLGLLKRLYQKGIHCLGTHFHTNYKGGKHLWPPLPHDWLSPQTTRRVTQDHVAEVDKLVGKIIGSDDPKAIRNANRTITGHFIDQHLAEQMGFEVQTGGRNEVRDEFLTWEKAHPGQSSFNYPVQVRDWERYPYRLKGLARELMYSHYVQQLDAVGDRGVDLHQLVRTDGRNWYLSRNGANFRSLRDFGSFGEIACDGETENIYVLWADKDRTRVDLSPIIKGQARVVAGAGGSESIVDSAQLVVGREPIVVQAAGPVAPAAPTTRMPIQFRMNVNYVPDEALARENCGVLRRHLDLFKQAGVKTSYWFTGLAAEQVQRVDPEFLRLLGEAGMPVGHHGANRPPNPQPIHRVKGQNWDDDVRAILDYESHAIDPRTGELDKTTIGGLKRMQVKAAEAVAASQTAPPEYIDLGGDYLSLADAFQAFAHALARFAESGKLPDSVQAVDLLGPTEYRASGLPPVMAAVTLPTVTGEEIVGAAKRVSPALRDRIPAEVAVGRHKLNPAEFLLAMGQTILAIAKTGQPKPVSLHAVDLLPASVRENRLADRLTKLQFWTFKPERSKHSTTAKAVQ